MRKWVLALLLSACAGDVGPAGPEGPSGSIGPTGATGATGGQGPGATVLRLPQPFGVLDSLGRGSAILPPQAGANVNAPPSLSCYLTYPNDAGTAPYSDDWVLVSTTDNALIYCAVVWDRATNRWRAVIGDWIPGWLFLFVVTF